MIATSSVKLSSDGRDSTVQLVHDAFIQKRECVDYRCRLDSRTDTGNRPETGLAGQTQIFVRGPHQPAFVMGLLRLVWNCH